MSHCLYEYKCLFQHLEWLKNTIQCCWMCWGWTGKWNRKSASGGSLYRWRCDLLKLHSFYYNVRVGLNFNMSEYRKERLLLVIPGQWLSFYCCCDWSREKPETLCRLLVKRSLGSNLHQTGHRSITEHAVTPSILEKKPHKARIKPRSSIT